MEINQKKDVQSRSKYALKIAHMRAYARRARAAARMGTRVFVWWA